MLPLEEEQLMDTLNGRLVLEALLHILLPVDTKKLNSTQQPGVMRIQILLAPIIIQNKTLFI